MLPEQVTEDLVINLLGDKVRDWVNKGPDAFYSLMYRLDISEKKLQAIRADKDVALEVAKLIYKRQLEKARSRAAHRDFLTRNEQDTDMLL